jgi:fused signal recognition particle receptor
MSTLEIVGLVVLLVGLAAAGLLVLRQGRKKRLEASPVAIAGGSKGEAAPAPASATPVSSAPADTRADVRIGLAKTRGGFVARLGELFGRKSAIDEPLLEEVEEVLLGADLGVATTARLVSKLRASHGSGDSEARAWDLLRAEALAILGGTAPTITLDKQPTVILFVGVNGVGKTTTIGKLASRFRGNGKNVLLAAGDTFRAAAVEQLEGWGRRVGVDVVRGAENADPSSVLFEAVQRAKTAGVDVLLADTAGRLHTKAPLMEELRKVGRTIEKALGRPPDHVLLVLDATNGQNAIQQALMFRDAIAVTGIVLTKLDGTAKGGVVLAIADQLRIPVLFIGVGEKAEHLRPFDAEEFVDVLFERSDSVPAETHAEH